MASLRKKPKPTPKHYILRSKLGYYYCVVISPGCVRISETVGGLLCGRYHETCHIYPDWITNQLGIQFGWDKQIEVDNMKLIEELEIVGTPSIAEA